MVKGGEEPRIALTWDDATPRAWDRWLGAAGQSTIEQSWAYGMAMAQTTPYNARTLTLRRGREVVAFALVFTWTLAGVVRIAKIVRAHCSSTHPTRPRGTRCSPPSRPSFPAVN